MEINLNTNLEDDDPRPSYTVTMRNGDIDDAAYELAFDILTFFGHDESNVEEDVSELHLTVWEMILGRFDMVREPEARRESAS